MILTDKQIRMLCNQQQLITPFCEESLQSESYDLSIGSELSRLRDGHRYLDIEHPDSLESAYDVISLLPSGYDLLPKEYVMVSVSETITLPETLTAHIRPRTRFTRLGLLVAPQHCNSTYSGILRVGLFNATNSIIKIRSGLHIAQIVFEQLQDIPSHEKQYCNKPNAAYQYESSFIGATFSDEANRLIDQAVDSLLGR